MTPVAAVVWPSWQFEAVTIAAAVAFGVFCGIGMARSVPFGKDHHATVPLPRLFVFCAGMTLLLIAVATPIETMANKLFVVQQTQAILLRMIIPIALVLSRPVSALIDVMAPRLRENFKRAFDEDQEASIGGPTQLIAAALVFVAVFGFWLVPRFVDLAARHPSVAVLMQASLLASGLFFWGCVLDARFSLERPTQALKLAMVLFATLAQIGAGAYLTMKSVVLYPALGASVRLFGISALVDETGGGATIWVAGSIICICTAIIVIHQWAKYEEWIDLRRTTWTGSNSDALLFPTTAAALIEIARPKNKILGLGAAALAIAMFGLVIATGVLNHIHGNSRPLATYARRY